MYIHFQKCIHIGHDKFDFVKGILKKSKYLLSDFIFKDDDGDLCKNNFQIYK